MIKKHGGLDSITLENIDEPKCGNNKVLVSIKASALNHLDIWVSNGLPGINIPLPLILGSDGAGTIVEVGKNIDTFKIGDDVVIQPGTFCSNCHTCMYTTCQRLIGKYIINRISHRIAHHKSQ